jgi:hypothetical protein
MDKAINKEDAQDANRVELLQWAGVGHVIHAQEEVEFNELVERCAVEGRALIENGWTRRDI